MKPSLPIRIALVAYYLSFLLAGEWLAAWVYLRQMSPMFGWSGPVYWGLTFVGFICGGLLAHGLLNFTVAWRRPDSPLLLTLDVVKGGFILPRIWPAFRVVGRMARMLALRRVP